MRTDGALLVPVGHDLGALGAESELEKRRQQIRAGTEVAEFADEDFAVWLLAHGSGEVPPSRESLLADAAQLGLPDADRTLDQLLDDGYLFEIHPDEESAVQFAESHQLVPLMLGLGPDSEQPWFQNIGLLNQPVVQVSNALYDVWSWARLSPHLWTGCHDAAEVARQVGATEADETEPRRVLSGVLRNVHGLLSVRAAYFDRRRG